MVKLNERHQREVTKLKAVHASQMETQRDHMTADHQSEVKQLEVGPYTLTPFRDTYYASMRIMRVHRIVRARRT